jgi:hypothetical protein
MLFFSVISTSDEDVNGVDRLSIPIYLKSEFQKSKKLNTQVEYFVEITASKTLQSVKIPINIFAEDEIPDRSWSSVLGFALVKTKKSSRFYLNFKLLRLLTFLCRD